MSRTLRCAVATLVVAAGLVLPGSARADATFVGAIGLDQHVFWEGGTVGWDPAYSLPYPSNSNVNRCALVGPCFTYTLTTTAPGAVLRVALDTPMRDDGFEVHV